LHAAYMSISVLALRKPAAIAETSATVGLAGDSHYREQSTSHHLRQGVLLSSLQACCHAFTLNLTCLRLFRDSQDERLRHEKTKETSSSVSDREDGLASRWTRI
jgi:hypothetical protein